MNTNYSTRRQFLKQTTGLALSAAAFPSLIPASALGQAGSVAPGSRIAVGCIGVGPQGQGDMGNFLNQKDAQVVAVCDVMQATPRTGPRTASISTTRTRTAPPTPISASCVARKDIDAVLIATPDHWHVLTAIAAVRAGKDVYLEKPMGLNLTEDWALRKEVHRHKRVFQFGTQQRSSRIFRLACALVRNGCIGKLQHINVWAPASAPGGSTQVVPVPPGLDYDLWLGPAPVPPAHAGPGRRAGREEDLVVYSRPGRRLHRRLGHSPAGHRGLGRRRAAQRTRRSGWPRHLPRRGHLRHRHRVEREYEVRQRRHPALRRHAQSSQPESPSCDIWEHEQEWKKRYRRITDHGTAFEGTDGWVHVDRSGINLQPENLIDQNEDAFKVQLTRSPDHTRNFLDCVRSRAQTVCPIDESVQSDALCHLSEIALHLNRKLVWDPKKERFLGDEEANLRLLSRKMREPWTTCRQCQRVQTVGSGIVRDAA